MAGDNLGASFSIDVTDLKAGLAEANRLIRNSESEFRAAAAGMDDWSNSSEGLSMRIKSLSDQVDIQKQKVNALVAEKQRIIDTMTEEGKSNEEIERAVDGVNKQITKESQQLDKLKDALDKSEKALDEFNDSSEDAGDSIEETGKNVDDAGKSAEDAGGKFGGLKSALGAAGKAFAAVAAAAASAVTAFFALAESTRESRENMAKLETGFTTAGHSAEDATKTYQELYGILGDDGQATEAAAHLAQLTNTQEELAQWTEIATGVYATFGDSLPIEGLTEAANETAKTGHLTGVLADALNWAGVSEDEFQASLDACTSEQERQALITNTLNGLYSEASAKYKEVNANVIAAREAQAKLNEALNELGAIAEPILTTLKTLSADLLVSITPFVKLIGEGLSGALEGSAGAGALLAQGLSGIVSTILDLAQNVLPVLLDIVMELVPSIVTALLEQLPTLLEFIVSDALPQILNTLSEVLPQIVQKIAEIVPEMAEKLVSATPQILEAAITLLMAIVQALPVVISELISALPSLIDSTISALLSSIPLLTEAAITLLMAIIDAIPIIIQALTENLPQIIDSIINGLLDALPLLLESAITLLMAIIDAIPVITQLLLRDIPNIVATITSTLISRLPDLLEAAVQLFMGIVQAIPEICVELVKNLPDIISTIVSSLSDGFSDIFNVGVDIIHGIWDGISSAAGWLWNQISGWASGLIDDIKGFFGISSPSKVMADMVGKNLALGIGEGFTDAFGGVSDDITRAAGKLSPTIGATVKMGANGLASGKNGVTVYQTNHYSQAHSRYEIYKSKQDTAAAVRLALGGV